MSIYVVDEFEILLTQYIKGLHFDAINAPTLVSASVSPDTSSPKNDFRQDG